jgi:hypothetical protein
VKLGLTLCAQFKADAVDALDALDTHVTVTVHRRSLRWRWYTRARGTHITRKRTRSLELPKVGDVQYCTILIFNPDFASTSILLILKIFAYLLRRIATNGIDWLIIGIS